MKTPWEGKVGVAQYTAIFATLLTISFGLCGANYLLVGLLDGISGSNSGNFWGSLLIATGLIESVGIFVGAAGLVGVLLYVIFRQIYRWFAPSTPNSPQD
jgi:hypothetical protein